MTPDCAAYNEASIELLDRQTPTTEAKVLGHLLGSGHRGAAWALTSAAIAGRLGDRTRDPGRGARRLHRTIARLRGGA